MNGLDAVTLELDLVGFRTHWNKTK